MASWQEGRFITDWADSSEVARLLDLLPVQEHGALSAEEQMSRRVAICNAFGIEAVARGGGIEYTNGVRPDNQPLLAALEYLFDRRFTSTQDGLLRP